jgi:hypothetical protein
MESMMSKFSAVVVLLVLLGSAGSQGQDAKVYKKISLENLEGILKSLDIDFKKTPSPNDKNLTIFTFERNKYKLALHYYGGKDLILVADFPSVPVALLNQWNRGAKFSRGILYQDAKNDFSTLEANLDVAGGVTDDTVRHFIRRYDDEVKKFEQLLFRAAVQEEEVATKITSEHLEKILKDMDIKFKKVPAKDEDISVYEFERDTFKVHLRNIKGEDLMLDAAFKEIPLSEVNQYNSGRKFIRAVLYQSDKGKKRTALEANLDCTGGVSDRIIRYFIGTFDGELREFAKFIAK